MRLTIAANTVQAEIITFIIPQNFSCNVTVWGTPEIICTTSARGAQTLSNRPRHAQILTNAPPDVDEIRWALSKRKILLVYPAARSELYH